MPSVRSARPPRTADTGPPAQRLVRAEAAAALAVDAGWLARQAARRITSWLDRGLVDSGLTSTQFSLMCLVAAADDDTLGALAQRAGVNQSTMSRNVDQLVAAGLAEVVVTEFDRRRRAVWLTETGLRQWRAAMPLWRAAQQSLADRLGVELAQQFVQANEALGE